jgi:hypothetical protein
VLNGTGRARVTEVRRGAEAGTGTDGGGAVAPVVPAGVGEGVGEGAGEVGTAGSLGTAGDAGAEADADAEGVGWVGVSVGLSGSSSRKPPPAATTTTPPDSRLTGSQRPGACRPCRPLLMSAPLMTPCPDVRVMTR